MIEGYDELNKNISNYKNFRNLEDFIAEFPTIKLQVDKETDELEKYFILFEEKIPLKLIEELKRLKYRLEEKSLCAY